MWASGTHRRRQQAALSEMVQAALRADDAREPWRAVPEVLTFFRDEAELLRHLQREWRTALAGAIYVAIEAGDGDLQHDVATAYDRTHRRHAGIRAVLEAHADHPAIAAAMRKEKALLSCVTRLAAA